MRNHNTNFIVRNVAGTRYNTCRCGTWLQHWRTYSGGTRKTCAKIGCQSAASVGAHVEFTDRRVRKEVHIVPLFLACNHWANGEEMPIDRRTWLVVADRPECAKV